MKITVAADQTEKLVAALRRSGIKETGGQLFGEQLAPSDFRVTELTVQSRRGTFARFVVDLLQAAKDAVLFLIGRSIDTRAIIILGSGTVIRASLCNPAVLTLVLCEASFAIRGSRVPLRF